MKKEFKLPKEFAEKWVASLRSGNYKQGPDHLFSENGYCCIGVAGSICGISDKDMLDQGLFDGTNDIEVPTNIPIELTGSCKIGSLVRKLVGMNDGGFKEEKKTFSEIADWIEANCEFY